MTMADRRSDLAVAEGTDRDLAAELTAALLRAEVVAEPVPALTNKTGAYVHRMTAPTVHTSATDQARTSAFR